MDTVFSTGDGSYYAFKGADYWRLTDDSVAPGYPRKIAEDWRGKILCMNKPVTTWRPKFIIQIYFFFWQHIIPKVIELEAHMASTNI